MPFIEINGHRLEYVWHGPPPEDAPTLVFLHEGLGCVAMWREVPRIVAETTGYGALVYSRAGYGNSDPAQLPRSARFMHDEALIVLPKVLEKMKIQRAILVGHSDGGSIALIHAGDSVGGNVVRGLILEAPHVFVEDLSISSIEEIGSEYRKGFLRSRLERYHCHVDETFWGWNDIWLDPNFRSWNIEEYLPGIQQPVLLLQGEQDQYGTLEQVRKVENGCSGSVHTVVLKDCSHSPHLDQPERTLEEIRQFITRWEEQSWPQIRTEWPSG